VIAESPHHSLLHGIGHRLPACAHRTVVEMVAAIADARPADPAAVSGAAEITYGQLSTWARYIAAELSAAGIGPGDRVAILVGPSLAMVAATLGALTSGAAYVPVDPSNPDGRIGQILADAAVKAVIVSEPASDHVAGFGYPVIRLRSAPGNGEPVNGEPVNSELVSSRPPPVPPPSLDAASPAYVIYTSGTTGEPKGVVVEHAQLTASTLARQLVYPGPATFLLLSPLWFDSSVAGLWGTLTSGGRLVVASADDVRDPERLIELIEANRVTHTLCVPALFSALLDAAERLGTERLRSLETVILAGEALPTTLVERHFAMFPGSIALVNEYGPTETTVWASYRRFTAPAPVTIGGPIPGARLYVTDDQGSLVAPGVAGELLIGGSGVAKGYFGRPAETARCFTDDLISGQPGARLYRTGDIVRWNQSGELEFIGRRDDQIKIRGHRLEPGAIEAALLKVPGIGEAAVLPNSDKTGLVAFAVAAAGVTAAAIRQTISQILPAVMIPAEIRLVDSLPRGSNGKIDRTALRRAAAEPAPVPSPSPSPAPPPGGTGGDDTIAQVAAAWAEVLDTADIPTDVNFFDLGGHSLSVFKLRDALERHTGVRPSVVALFRDTTVIAQAALVKGSGADDGRPAVGPARDRRALAATTRRRRLSRESSR
jgi:amino acid adenylation domain-containing protein